MQFRSPFLVSITDPPYSITLITYSYPNKCIYSHNINYYITGSLKKHSFVDILLLSHKSIYPIYSPYTSVLITLIYSLTLLHSNTYVSLFYPNPHSSSLKYGIRAFSYIFHPYKPPPPANIIYIYIYIYINSYHSFVYLRKSYFPLFTIVLMVTYLNNASLL